MAEGNKTQAHLLKYTGEGLNSILERADTVIKTAQNNETAFAADQSRSSLPPAPHPAASLV